jgi:hypothetical protein
LGLAIWEASFSTICLGEVSPWMAASKGKVPWQGDVSLK